MDGDQMVNGFTASKARICWMLAAVCLPGTVLGQTADVDSELERFKGHWRVTEMVEDGTTIPEQQMRYWLPGGGVLEIIDFTILFESPADGTKSTKSFRIDPTSYPKQIAVSSRDTITGRGIYEFDQERLVLCLSTDTAEIPSRFAAPTGSKRMLLVLERFEPGKSTIPGINAPLPPRQTEPSVRSTQTSRTSSGQTTTTQPTLPPPPTTTQQVPAQAASTRATPTASATSRVAAQVLTDSQVRKLAIGTWRINDSEGSIDITFNESGVFQTYRYTQAISNFHVVFLPTPISSGKWAVDGGRLIATVTSSTRLDRVNQSFIPAVRSISATDMILVDHLGRVSRAVKVR